jgi:ribose-phosphate pyrophosphokinase
MIILQQGYSQEQIVEFSSFPGGEQHVNIKDLDLSRGEEPIYITAYLKSSNNIMQLLLLTDAIRRVSDAPIILVLPYLPYARQDRICNYGEALSIDVMANLINSIGARRVQLYDPHSDVSTALIKNVSIFHQSTLVYDLLMSDIAPKKWTILAPDAGSLKKINCLYEDAELEPYVTATKIRNPKDGKITDIKIYGTVRMKDIIIIDDICDGGATFIGLAKELRERQARSIRLYVTHGIFSKGLGELYEYFDEIYCYYTFLMDDTPYFQRLKILGGFNHDN